MNGNAPIGTRWRLIEVDYIPGSETWTVWFRPSERDEWARADANPEELGAVLKMAHDAVNLPPNAPYPLTGV